LTALHYTILHKIGEPEIRVVDSLFCFKLAVCNVTLTSRDMGSSKTRDQMIIGTSIGIFAVLAIGIFSSFSIVIVADDWHVQETLTHLI
jgi:hypothetical protein